MAATLIEAKPVQFKIRWDIPSVVDLLRRIRANERMANVLLFGRKNPLRLCDRIERRSRFRSAVQIPIYIVPVTFDGRSAAGVPGAGEIQAFTRDVSLRGVGFTHDEMLDAEFAVATFDLVDDEPVSLLLELRWSNLRQGGSPYMSGSTFCGVASPV